MSSQLNEYFDTGWVYPFVFFCDDSFSIQQSFLKDN